MKVERAAATLNVSRAMFDDLSETMLRRFFANSDSANNPQASTDKAERRVDAVCIRPGVFTTKRAT